MAGNKIMTEKDVQRIWYLKKKGLDVKDIAMAVERSYNSVYRTVNICELTQRKEWDELESRYGKYNQNLIALAKKLLCVEPQAAPEPAEKKPFDNTAKYLCDVLVELHRNNELLEKLLAVWEAK